MEAIPYHSQVVGTDPQARLVVSAGHKGTVWLDMVSLFPRKTWKGAARAAAGH